MRCASCKTIPTPVLNSIPRLPSLLSTTPSNNNWSNSDGRHPATKPRHPLTATSPSLLHRIATSGLHDSIESDALLSEAIGHLHRTLGETPDDLGSVHLLAKCQLRRGNVQALPAILDHLRTQPDSEAIGTAIEVEYLAAEGRWQSASRSAEQLPGRASTARHFWQGLKPMTAAAPAR